MGKRALLFLLAAVLWTAVAQAQTAPVQGPTLWVRGFETFVPLRQTDYTNPDLYVSEEWATTTYFGIPRYAETCLATVYAIVEHARGNTDYRVGQAGTWTDATGAEPYEWETNRGIEPSIDRISSELINGNPVILQGYSDALDANHFMLAVGLTAAGNIIALDPLTGTQIEIDGESLTAALTTAQGASLEYSIETLRTIDFSGGEDAVEESAAPATEPAALDATPAPQQRSLPTPTDEECVSGYLTVGRGESRCGIGLSDDSRLLLNGHAISEPILTRGSTGPNGAQQWFAYELHLYPLSPNGQYRALTACDEIVSFCARLWVMDVEAGDARQTFAGRYGPDPDRIWWSPDSTHVAFSYGTDGFDWLYVVRAADGYSQELTTGAMHFSEGENVWNSDKRLSDSAMMLNYDTLTWVTMDLLEIDGFACAQLYDADTCLHASRRQGNRPYMIWVDGANIGLSSGQVAEAQRLLTRLGYDPGPVDGLFGLRTLAAIQAFRYDRDALADAGGFVLLDALRAAGPDPAD